MNRRTILAAAASTPALAQSPLKLYGAGPGSAFLPYAEGLANFLRGAGIAAEARTSTGSLQNLGFVEDDAGALGTAFLGSVQDAQIGRASCRERVCSTV